MYSKCIMCVTFLFFCFSIKPPMKCFAQKPWSGYK